MPPAKTWCVTWHHLTASFSARLLINTSATETLFRVMSKLRRSKLRWRDDVQKDTKETGLQSLREGAQDWRTRRMKTWCTNPKWGRGRRGRKATYQDLVRLVYINIQLFVLHVRAATCALSLVIIMVTLSLHCLIITNRPAFLAMWL